MSKLALAGRRSLTLSILALLTLSLTWLILAGHFQGQPAIAAGLALDPRAPLPLAFEPNVGQTDAAVRFLLHAPRGVVFFTPSELVIKLAGPRPPDTDERPGQAFQSGPPSTLRLRFLNAANAPSLVAGAPLPGRVNYFLGNDPARWRTNIVTYTTLTYTGLYPGIDLSYGDAAGLLKGTYTVAPGADPARIRWRYVGATQVTLGALGRLQLSLPGGRPGDPSLTVTEQAPIAWQDIAGQRRPVSVRYAVAANNSVSFALGAYDPAYPLVIDPTLSYSTYLGGSSADEGRDIIVDAAGNMYVVGMSYSTNFPTQNPVQGSNYGGNDVVVTKLNAAGTALVFSTYLGDLYDEYGRGIALDSANNIYLTGQTSSPNFPVQNAFQSTYRGNWDAFVTKLSPDGASLLYSTLLGGRGANTLPADDGYEIGLGVAVDSGGNAYVTGYTGSSDFPVQSPLQPYRGNYDAFLTKLNPTGNGLVYSTWLGGDGTEYGEGMTIDPAGNAYVTGRTTSTFMPVQNAFQPSLGGGRDGMLMKVNAAGTALVYSTYLGGSGTEKGYDIAVDAAGHAYITGMTMSTNFPTTANAFQRTLGGNATCVNGESNGDAYVADIDTTVSGTASLIYSTLLGGSGCEVPRGLALDGAGNVYVTGWTDSNNFPLQAPVQSARGGGEDVFVTKLNASGSALGYSTYLGGGGDEYGWAIWVDGAGSAYVTGSTDSVDFPGTNNPLFTYQGSTDTFIAKLSEAAPPPTPTRTPSPVPPTATASSTPLPPTATATKTAPPPTATATETAVPPTATATKTNVPPTASPTKTSAPATATATSTPLPPTPTATNTPLPATATATKTALPPTATATSTTVPATATATSTPLPPTATATATSTPLPPAATPTATATFRPDWYGPGWNLRKALTIDKTRVSGSGNLVNFPVLVSLTDTDLRDDAQDDGDDILFTASDGKTKLDHEIERFDGATGALVAWVRVPTLGVTANTVLYLYYGNPTATSQQNRVGVWDASYKLVQHLNQSPAGAAPQMKDATGNHNDGTTLGGMTGSNLVETQIGPGLLLDGVNDGVDITTETALAFQASSSFTYQAWIKTDDTATRSVILGDYNNRPAINLEIEQSTGHLRPYIADATGGPKKDYVCSTNIANNVWHLVAMTYTGAGQVLDAYVDGVKETCSHLADGKLNGSLNNATTLKLGTDGRNLFFLEDLLDEVRVSAVARTTDWLRTEYNNQFSPATFYTLGPEQAQ